MTIQTYPVKLTTLYRLTGDCEGCSKAWSLYRKSRTLFKKFKKAGANDSNRHIARRAHWLSVKAAQALYEDRENHFSRERECPLTIVNGSAKRQMNYACWNCHEPLYASWSKYSESIFCKACMATMYYSWLSGEWDDKEVRKYAEQRMKEPFMSNGLWEDFRWSKKKQDMVPRRKDNGNPETEEGKAKNKDGRS